MPIQTSESVVAASATATSLIGANPYRRALYISSPHTNQLTISSKPGVTSLNGLTLQPGTDLTILLDSDLGDWVKRNLFCILDAGTETIGVLEVIEV